MSRFYGELAPWWPLISPVEEYAEEASEFRRVLAGAMPSASTCLELGSGGGHNAFYLKEILRMTLSDLSEEMLAVSRALNPECEHVQGDMRTLDLARTFDVVFVHDAVDYMTAEVDLAAAIATAHRHCRPGGVALFVPDATTETFEASTDCGGTDAPDGRGIRYMQWSYDLDPGDTSGTTHYAFLAREADGTVRSFDEAHAFGLFPRATWVRLLTGAGFEVEVIEEQTEEDRTPRSLFLGRRPPLR